MHRTCIAVVDATRARIFTLDRSSDPDGVHETIEELNDLVNPTRRLTPAELFSDSRPGTNRTGRLQYAFDDHRDAHMRAFDAEFASAISRAIANVIRETRTGRLILCAGPKMLGALRRCDLGGVETDELAHDYTKLSVHEIRRYLGDRGLLPAPPARPAR